METLFMPNCEHSSELEKISPALIAAIGEMESATKDASNPHFKSKYADLTSIMDVAKPALSKHGIAVLQPPVTALREGGSDVTVATILLHTSGQWIASKLTLAPQTETPQAIGSAITYARRYGLGGLLGMTAEDDDGNAASQGHRQQRTAPPPVVSQPRTAPRPQQMPQTAKDLESEDPALVDYLNRASFGSEAAKEVYAEIGGAIKKATDHATAKRAWADACRAVNGKAPAPFDVVRSLYRAWLGVSEPQYSPSPEVIKELAGTLETAAK